MKKTLATIAIVASLLSAPAVSADMRKDGSYPYTGEAYIGKDIVTYEVLDSMTYVVRYKVKKGVWTSSKSSGFGGDLRDKKDHIKVIERTSGCEVDRDTVVYVLQANVLFANTICPQ